MIEGVYVDDTFDKTPRDVFDLLWKSKERDLVEKWGIWLLRRDRALGLRVPFQHPRS